MRYEKGVDEKGLTRLLCSAISANILSLYGKLFGMPGSLFCSNSISSRVRVLVPIFIFVLKKDK